MTLLFDFSSATTEPPTSNQLRFDAAVVTAITRVWVRLLTSDGIDAYRALLDIAAGTLLYVQDKNDHTLYVRVRTTGAPIDKTDYIEVPVVFVEAGAPLNNNQAIALVTAAATGVSPSGAGLVSLGEACAHLRIPIPADDPDLEGKLAAAEAIILDYLNLNPATRDLSATWTSATVPLPVKQAILLELGELWRFRGDDPEAPPRWPPANAEGGIDLAPAIIGLLRRIQPLVVS